MESPHDCTGTPVGSSSANAPITNSNQTDVSLSESIDSRLDGFEYQPLDVDTQEIRLFQFSSKRDHIGSRNEISLTMLTVPLGNVPPFLALSYVWGEPRFTHPITCNGQRLLLTQNLARALRTIRGSVSSNSTPLYNRGDEIFLWADGICINQEDKVEKSTQVPLMKDVYAKARGVIAYIGAPKHGDPNDGFVAFALAHGVKVMLPDEIGQQVVPKLDWSAWRQLVEQPFFSRSWMFQEMVLASYVLCLYGDERRWASWSLHQFMAMWTPMVNKSLDKDNLSHVQQTQKSPPTDVAERDQLARILDINMLNLEAWRYLREQSEGCPGGLDPIIVLSQSRRANSSDLRDKIYSVMSLFTKDHREGIKVDYSSNNAATNTFIDFAKSCIRSGLGNSLLEHAGISQRIQDLPSWVPDWSFEPRYQPNFFKNFKCAGSTLTHISLSDAPGKIQIRGWLIGDVEKSGLACGDFSSSTPIPSHPEFTTDSQAIAVQEMTAFLWCEMMSEPDFDCFGDNDFRDAIWRTLWLDQNSLGKRAKASDRKYYDAWLETHPRSDVETSVPVVWGDERGDAMVFKRACQHMQGRVLCLIIGQGTVYIGALPSDAAKGDLIALFMGMRTPFAIRPVEGTPEFRLIGPCYIYGIMDGELVSEDGENPQFCTGEMWKDFVIQ